MVSRNDLIRVARIALGWTQEDLAAKAGVNKRTVSRYERGLVVTRRKVVRETLEAAGIRFVPDGIVFSPRVFGRSSSARKIIKMSHAARKP